MSKKILVCLSEWGYWGEELVGPYDVLIKRGYTLDFMTPFGRKPPALPPSMVTAVRLMYAGAAFARGRRGAVSRDGIQGRVRSRASARLGDLRREARVPSVAAARHQDRSSNGTAPQGRDPGMAGATTVPGAAAW